MYPPPAATVIVPDYQLSLAIGKRGQNARLAAKLTGYKIDIKSETEADDIAAQPEPEAEESSEAPEITDSLEADSTVSAEETETSEVASGNDSPAADAPDDSADND